MPNWCNNTLRLESGKSIQKFLEPYIEEVDSVFHFDFNKVIPIPDDLMTEARFGEVTGDLQKKYDSNMEKYGYTHWYDFCVAKWGTKWSAEGEFTQDETMMWFDTAWSPPIGVIEELAKKLPDDDLLILDYMEEGENYCGKYVAGNQGGTDESYSPIDNAPQCIKDEFGWEPWNNEDEDEEEEVK
jgi:hypothetical protein